MTGIISDLFLENGTGVEMSSKLSIKQKNKVNNKLNLPISVQNKWESGHPDSQNCWRTTRFLNLGIRWIAMFNTCLYIRLMARMPTQILADYQI